MENVNVKGIHPSNLVKREKQIFKKELAGYLDRKGRFKYGKNTSCPICNSNRLSLKFSKNGFKFVKCQKCNLVFVNPRPTVEFLKKYYTQGPAYKYMQEVILPKTAKFRSKIIFKPKLDIVNKFFKKNRNKILDIGCASGNFLNLASKYAWDCYGVEPSQDAVKLLKKRFSDIKVFNTTVEELETQTKFNVVSCWELIEHVLNPLKVFKKIFSILDKSGVFVLSTPNSEGFDMMMLEELSDVYLAPNHLNYFNPKAITYALKKAGFKKIEITTPGIFDLDKVVNALKLSKPTPDLKDKFIKFLQKNKWSGHMVVVGFK